ncbi:unnamed protein product [Symbiodinium sp. CCMP2456]|nr:unnamed protein product [Symbiodinium sp. CCMP2456]
MIDAFRESMGISITVFKIGVTSNPVPRFVLYRTKHFTNMWVIHSSMDVKETHMLEAALILFYQDCVGCQNKPNSGGEGALNRKTAVGPFYTYIAGGRADQNKRAPCKHAVEQAQAALKEAGGVGTPALKEFAAIKLNDAESPAHKIFHKYGLAADVAMKTLDVGSGELKKFPYLPFSEWVKFLLDNDQVEQLVGVPAQERPELLQEFWCRYERLHPAHDIFELSRQGRVNLRQTIPVFCHVDDGRTYKSKGLLVLSVHGALGQGTAAYKRRMGVRKTIMKQNPMGMNYIGNTWGTQFFFCSLLRSAIAEDEAVLDKVLSVFSKDMEELAISGVQNTRGNDRLWCQLLAVKGDLPALAKIGNFERHYLRAPKRATSRSACIGVCWLCKAGQETPNVIPYEDYRETSLWRTTFLSDNPWLTRPAILGSIPVDRTSEPFFFRTDLWHNWHNGLSKYFIANAMHLWIVTPDLIPAGTIELKFKYLTQDYLNYCSKARLTPYLKEINRDTISFESAQSQPHGCWNKAVVSTHLMLYLQDFCLRFVDGKFDEAKCIRIMNIFISSLYSEGFWIPSAKARELGNMLNRFLVLYGRCAAVALDRKMDKFTLVPKGHMLDHHAFDLVRQAGLAEWVENPLSTANQQQEDYIGKPCRLSRRVHASKIHLRVLQRSLLASSEQLQAGRA